MNKVEVFYKETFAGVLEKKIEGHFIFIYEESYIASNNPSISLTLPKETKSFKNENLFPFFDGLIPEGWLLKLASEELRLDPLQDRFELLKTLCRDTIGAIHIGKPENEKKTHELDIKLKKAELPVFDRCLICYKEHQGIYHLACMKKVFGTTIHPIVEIDNEIIEVLGRNQLSQKLAIAGVQKKISLDLKLDTQTKEHRITVTDLWGKYIFKPRGKAPHLPENEHLCLLMAEMAGIKVEKSALIPTSSGELGFLARRFDRGDKHEEFHQEDFCQILEKEPFKKYQGSLEQVGKVIKKSSDFPGDNLYRLMELIVFNFLIGNVDFHLKNISLTFENDKGYKTLLSPAYDLLSTDLYIDDDNEQTALAINGRKNQLRRIDFLECAKSYSITEKVFDKILSKFEKMIPVWNQTINQSFIEKERQEKLTYMVRSRLIMLQTISPQSSDTYARESSS